MQRRAKGKSSFKMKGHTLPGINQRSETAPKKDGRSSSSAFQMKSPLHEEKLGDVDFDLDELDVYKEKERYDAMKARGREQGESELSHALDALNRAAMRGRAAKEAKKKEKGEEESEEMDLTTHQRTVDPTLLNEEDLAIFESDPETLNTKDLQRYRELYGYDPNYDLDSDDRIKDIGGDGDIKSFSWPPAEEAEEVVDEVEEEEPVVEEALTEETTMTPVEEDYTDATKSEMYDLRRPFREDGTWDPDNNPEHAKIQNKINELHDAPKRYSTSPVQHSGDKLRAQEMLKLGGEMIQKGPKKGSSYFEKRRLIKDRAEHHDKFYKYGHSDEHSSEDHDPDYGVMKRGYDKWGNPVIYDPRDK